TSGEKILCQVVDISTEGAQLITRSKPSIGTRVKIGKQMATIIRHTESGVGLAFAASRRR
ncbi:MAG: PilZ domain-containing protein, partial [Pseudomonadota bacterium]